MTLLRPGAALAAVAALFVAAACGGSASSGSSSSSCSTTYKVGLVTDVGKLSDKSFNANSWLGVQQAAADKSLCVQAKAIESNSSDDYAKNLRLFGDGVPDNPMSNVVGLVFKEDQAGFLAGAVAGLYTKTGVIAGVYGLQIPPVERYRQGFEAGAKYVNPNMKDVLGVYQAPCNCPKDFNDPDWGKARGLEFADRSADVIFGAGGNTGNGALLAALQRNVACIGVDVDQYLSYPEADGCLLTSAEKHLSVAVKTAVADAAQGHFKGGVRTFDATNNGVGAAPYLNFDSKLTSDQKAKIDQIAAGLKDGSIKTGATS